jgi:hypothetical protein
MSDKFTVTPAALEALGRDLRGLATQLDDVRVRTQRIDCSAFEYDGLVTAMTTFLDDWKWQAEKLRDRLEQTGSRLETAAANYQEVENAQQAAQGQVQGC